MSNQFELLQGWIFDVLHAIKKDIKTEHLSSDPIFYKTYFGNRPQNRLTAEEIYAAYEKELLKGNEDLSAWVVNRWVFKHGEVYTFFAERLSKINPNFEAIQNLTEAQSEQILNGCEEMLGAQLTFLFAVLNGVVFPESVIQKLRKAAEAERERLIAEDQKAAEQQSLEQTVASHQREMARLNDKYESRLAGIQKKYVLDTEALKKQIRGLQQKLQAVTNAK